MINIVKVQEHHLPAILRLERQCFTLPWSENSFRFEMESPDAHFAAAEEAGELLGFCIMHRMCDEGEIFNVAVSPEKRRLGVGNALIKDALCAAKRMGVKRLFLEVRKSNEIARRLYEKNGFSVCGVRKNYYDAPKEDAILMDAELPLR